MYSFLKRAGTLLFGAVTILALSFFWPYFVMPILELSGIPEVETRRLLNQHYGEGMFVIWMSALLTSITVHLGVKKFKSVGTAHVIPKTIWLEVFIISTSVVGLFAVVIGAEMAAIMFVVGGIPLVMYGAGRAYLYLRLTKRNL